MQISVTLQELGLDYLDCWMVHAPWAFVPHWVGHVFISFSEILELLILFSTHNQLEDEKISCKPREDKFGAMVEEIEIIETWREMEKCVELGLCKSIAVSNFNRNGLRRMINSNTGAWSF